MNDKDINAKARELFLKDYTAKVKRCGNLTPTVNKSPLHPPWTALEYSAMEEDSAKYFLYYTAIKNYMESFKKKGGTFLTCLVLGAGRGRFVDYVKDCFQTTNLDGVCHVIEANKKAVNMLKDRFHSDNNVTVYPPMVVRDYEEIMLAIKQKVIIDKKFLKLTDDKNVDLVISELFGSFADNEFVGEILNCTTKLFCKRDKKGIMKAQIIPENYTKYLTPINSYTLSTLFCKTKRSYESFYIVEMPSDTKYLSSNIVCDSRFCDEMSFCTKNKIKIKLQHCQDEEIIPLKKCKKSMNLDSESLVKISQNGDTEAVSNCIFGFVGHFRACLYGNIYIDTCLNSPERNTYFWESTLFPLHINTQNKVSKILKEQSTHTNFELKMTRIVLKIPQPQDPKDREFFSVTKPVYKMWYEWEVFDNNLKPIGICHNKNGLNHSLFL